jgi:pimeloyl-ACP methyl ester carboxylesterase
MPPSPFTIHVPDSVLDLRARLARTRLPARTQVRGGRPGPIPTTCGSCWPTGPTDSTGGLGNERSTPLPLLLTHGWPSSFAEMLPLVPLLTDPGRHGGDPADAFDVVLPSLPGHIFSDLPPAGPVTRPAIADALARLMTDVLGYQRFGAYGGDIGADVTNWLAIRYPDRVVGIHLIHPKLPTTIDPDRPLSTAEQAYLDRREVEDEADGGYSAIQATRPDTLAAALMDSPSGLAAWILDKYRAWSDCHGDLETRFSRDELLTGETLPSAGTSCRWKNPACSPARFAPSSDPSITADHATVTSPGANTAAAQVLRRTGHPRRWTFGRIRTKTPRPCSLRTSPSVFSTSIAWRAVSRVTP